MRWRALKLTVLSDLARAHLAALSYSPAPGQAEAFNIGTGAGITVREMLTAFSQACGRDLPFELLPRCPGDLPAYYADPAKARGLLNWQADLGLPEICETTWKWQSQNPTGYRS